MELPFKAKPKQNEDAYSVLHKRTSKRRCFHLKSLLVLSFGRRWMSCSGGTGDVSELHFLICKNWGQTNPANKQTQPTNRKYGHVAMLRIRRFLKIGGKNVGEWQGQEMQRESKAIQCLFCCWSSPWSRMIFNPGRMEQTWGLGATDE